MAGFNALVGLRLAGMDGDAFLVELDVAQPHLQDLGQVHGGVYLALADTAMARVAIDRLGGHETVQTAALQTSFLRPFSSGTIRARGRIVKIGRRLIFAEASLEGGGRILATASATLVRSGQGGDGA